MNCIFFGLSPPRYCTCFFRKWRRQMTSCHVYDHSLFPSYKHNLQSQSLHAPYEPNSVYTSLAERKKKQSHTSSSSSGVSSSQLHQRLVTQLVSLALCILVAVFVTRYSIVVIDQNTTTQNVFLKCQMPHKHVRF